MECPKCRAENRETRKFCAKCGQKLVILCPQCSAENLPDEQFCGECGHDLRKPKETKPLDYDQPHSYTPKHLADKILTNRSSIEGERKLVTILFADVANSTAMFENLDPESVHDIMDGCFRILMDEIHRYEGTINQFRGDGVMALFGAPIAHEDHAQRACHASLAIQKTLAPYCESLKNRYGIDFKMRIGLNSGPVVVGSIGDDLRMDYTAQGDTANLASRMESNAQPGCVLVSNHIYKQAKEFFEFEPIGEIQVKGKEEPVQAYRLIRPTEVETRIAASAAKGLTRFVGRKRHMEELKEAFETVKSGEGQVVGIVGEAGVGKSRLLLEFRNTLPKGHHWYYEGRCLHYGGSMPYLPILDITRSLIGVKEGEQEHVIRQKLKEIILGIDQNLAHVIPPFQELLSLKVDDEEFAKLEPKQKREKTFEAIRDLLIRGSQDRPVVLVVEDLHWIDKTTEEFFTYMIGWLPKTRILLLLLYRPEYTHKWGSKSYYRLITLGQLSTSTSAELVAAILEGGNVVPELRDLILNRAAGNPLFMEELTHALVQNGSIQKKDDRFILARDISTDQVPDTIQGIIAARMDRLEESLKRIMQVAAVIGREFAFRILETITEMKEELKSGLINLQGLEFIYEKSLFPDLEYIFRHALVQEVAYNSLLINRRKEIHEKIGRAIESLYPQRLEEFYEMLAYHYSKSERKERACHYLQLSGNKAARNESLREAFRFYEQALNLLKTEPETDENKAERLKVILSMAPSMRVLGYPEDSEGILHEGERLANELGNSRILASMYGWTGMYHMQKGAPLLAIQHQENAFLEAEKTGDVSIIAPTAWQLCVSLASIQNWPKAIEVFQRVIPLVEQTATKFESFGTPLIVYPTLLGMHGYCLGAQGDFRKGKALLDQAYQVAQEISHRYTMGWICCWQAGVCVVQGDAENGIQYSRESLRYFEESQAILFLPIVLATSGYAHYLANDLESARRQVEKGLQLQRELGSMFWFSVHSLYLALIHIDSGDYDRGRTLAQEAVGISEKIGAKHLEGQSKALLGRIITKIDKSRSTEAETLIMEAIKIFDELKERPDIAVAFLYLAEIYIDSGQRDKSFETIKKAEGMFREMGMDYWLGKAQEALAKL